jgi:enoyl-CoA hydratase/carnithine racemase
MNNERETGALDFETLKIHREGSVIFADIYAPPMNVMGPELIRDLISLIITAEADHDIQILVFRSADPDYFISHVDVTRIKENRAAAMELNGEASIGILLNHLSRSRLVSIAQIEGRVRGVGSEFVLACDMRFAALETAIFNQFEPSFGVIPGAGAVQHLARLMGRGRALEVMMSAEDYSAQLAERYGWINRAMPALELGNFVGLLAQRIANFPAIGRLVLKERVNAIGLPSVDEIRRDSDLFLEGTGNPQYHERMNAALKHGFQTREGELNFSKMLNDLSKTSNK